MKKLIIQLKYKLLLLFCCSFLMAAAQTLPNITKVEYFVDNDPGFGKGTAVSITPATDLNNISFTVNIGSLAPGFHNLHVRAQDVNGKWSIVNTKTFYKDNISANLANIARVEYFIDTDPGFGKGTSVPITPAIDINNILFTVNIGSLSPGFHNLHVRAQDANGKWSIVNTKSFYKDNIPVNLPNIIKAEYFVDNDPGFGKGINIPVTPASDIINLDFTADISSYAAGQHRLFVRAQDANGKWSIVNNRSFVICSNPLPVPTVSGKTNYCPGETIQLNGSTVTGATSYLWKGPNNFTSTQQNISITNITAAKAGQYYFWAIRSGGTACDTSNPVKVNVIMNAPGAPQSLGLSGRASFCPGDSVILSTVQVNGFRYRWQLNGSNTSNPGDTTNSIVIKTSGKYNVRITNTSGCAYLMRDTVITVFAKPATSNITGNANVLLGSTQNYNVNNTSGSAYAWFVTNGTILSGNGTNNISVEWPNLAGTGSVKVVETDGKGCIGDTQSKNINISSSMLNVDPDSLNYIAAGETKQVVVASNISWTASTDQPAWVTISPLSGNGNGNVNITVSANASQAVRTATVTFTAGTLKDSVIINQDFTSGISEQGEVSGIMVFPNPSTGFFTIENTLKERADVRVYDATGRIVDNFVMQPSASISLNYSHLSPAIYIMNIITEKGIILQRLVITK